MPDHDSQIFAIALILFLLISCAEMAIKQLINFAMMTVEQLIALVVLVKKLKATIESKYSLKTGKLEIRVRPEQYEPPRVPAIDPAVPAGRIPESQPPVEVPSDQEVDDNPPS
jgi:hypothetical protein